MGEVNWLEDPLGPYYLEDALEIDDADGVSLGSLSSTAGPLEEEVLSPELTSAETLDNNNAADVEVNISQPLSPFSDQYPLGLTVTREHRLKSLISSRPELDSLPAIIRRNDSNGAIHFQDSGHSHHLPLLSSSSLRSFTSQSCDSFAAAGGLVVSKPSAKGMSLSKLPSKLPRAAGWPRRSFHLCSEREEKGANNYTERLVVSQPPLSS
ncbi:hypothetical protein F5876DRAFT_85291 [Lentinula aff. lateritia]|uniref:Uncharacterized protein n=1 Tax=Lentinula aff. lateritia TaxID=2804960 RepID=A0ACC1TFK4_9AGAR|nr:hypothetical protein F5876DRAFT_85291 [Lentinula aff. lateritia]